MKKIKTSVLTLHTRGTVGVIQGLSLRLDPLGAVLAHVESKLVDSIIAHSSEYCQVKEKFHK